MESDDITQPGSIKIIEGEGMPIMDSNERGHLYVQFQVKIPEFDGEELDELELFFQKHNKK